MAREYGVTLHTVQRWVSRANGLPLDEVNWSSLPAGSRQSAVRSLTDVEDRVLQIRKELKEDSALGEYGAEAIGREMQRRRLRRIPSQRTIGRILERRGALDGKRRTRRPAPPRGWFLPEVAAEKVELDSFDIVEDLVIEGGEKVNVLNGISLHGALCCSWPREQITAKNTVISLMEHWHRFGLPGYVKFDNDTVFQGAHQYPDSFGRVTRLCLSLRVIPLFAPPLETGFQAEIESYNGRWEAKVWQRFHFASRAEVVSQSRRYVNACRRRHAARIDSAPPRRPFPAGWELELQTALRGTVIYLRRTSDSGKVTLLGHSYETSSLWCNRLIRAEVDLTNHEIRMYSLRRRVPQEQTLLNTHEYHPPQKRFRE